MAREDQSPDYSALQAQSWEDMYTGPYAAPGSEHLKAAGMRSKAEAQKRLMDRIEQRRTMDKARLNLQFQQPGSRYFPGGPKGRGSVSNPNSAQAIYHYLTDVRGMRDSQARGVLANFIHESSLLPGGLNPDDRGKPAWGLAQWRGSRRELLEKHVPDWQTNWQGQLDFMFEHDAPYDRRVLSRYMDKDFGSPEEAAAYFTERWERPQYGKEKGKQRARAIARLPF